MKLKALTISALLGAASLLACASDTTEPNALAGSYFSSEFITTGTGGQTNQLLAGSFLNITLGTDGTTTGTLHLAASGGNPAFDADMAGTWARQDNTVTFSQSADTFVRDMPFTVVAGSSNSWALTGDHVFSGTRIQLTLSQGIRID